MLKVSEGIMLSTTPFSTHTGVKHAKGPPQIISRAEMTHCGNTETHPEYKVCLYQTKIWN